VPIDALVGPGVDEGRMQQPVRVGVVERGARSSAGSLLIKVPEGGFVFIPRGTPQTAWNSGDAPMLGMIVISPGDAEHLFEPAQTT
jgi:hypothetical protein